MTRNSPAFLQLLHSILTGKKSTNLNLTSEAWADLFSLSAEQDVLPLIYDAFSRSEAYRTASPEVKERYGTAALQAAVRQITRSNEFLTLILHAQEIGLDPVVLKGIICREIYPQPYLRISVDEDILIRPEEAEAFHRFFLSEGLFEDGNDAEPLRERIENASELSYLREDSPTYIEVHKELFDPDSGAYGDLNRLFEGMAERTVRVQIEDVSVRTLAPTDHLLYLILHAFKHFVHSGIGIRSVCDIGQFAEHYASDIDWEHIRSCLEEVHAFDFTRALLCIVQHCLLPDAAFYCCISDWKIEEIDTEPLLEDILSGGVHGNASLERLHSSNITLNAIENDRKESYAGQGFLSTAFHSVFLPLGKMSVHYPYLKKAPFLLPAAWTQRIGKYLQERKTARKGSKSTAAGSIRLGRSRVELLKKYGIIR